MKINMLISRVVLLAIIIGGYFSHMANGSVQIYGHRGMAGLYPENTLEGYAESIKLGVDSLDIDVALTKDNIVVGSHDPFLNKDLTRDSTGQWLKDNNSLINDYTFAELQQFDVGKINPLSSYYSSYPEQCGMDGIKIPSMEQVMQLIKSKGNNNHKLQIEIKTSPERENQEYIEKFVKSIIDTLEKNNFIDKAELQSFDWRTLIYAKQLNANVKTSFITEQSMSFDIFADYWPVDNTQWTAGYRLVDYNGSMMDMMANLGADNWCPLYTNVTPELVAEAHAKNIKVIPWTADTKQDMIKLISAGVDGIITNRPDLLREVMQELDMTLPA